MSKLSQKLRRALYLVPYVAKHPGGVPVSELAAILGTGQRELERDIADLLTAGVPGGSPADFVDISIEGRGPSARVFAMPSRVLRRPPRLTPQEAFALLLGASTLRKTGIQPFDEAIGRADGKIRKLLHASGESEVSREAGIVIERGGHEREDVLATLSRASRDRRAVELDYASLAGQRRRKFEVEPFGLLNHRGGWYIVGNSVTHAENRIFFFKVERILGVKALARTFTVPKDFDLRKYAREHLFIAGGAAVDVKLRLRGAAAANMGDWFAKSRRERGGSVLVRFKDYPTGWLAAWILRQGPDVEVVSPPQLARWVASMAKRVASEHASV